MATTHTVDVNVLQLGDAQAAWPSPGGMQYHARCDCGWTGPLCVDKALAAADGEHHRNPGVHILTAEERFTADELATLTPPSRRR
jgi:hypothetical protein